MGGGIQRVGVYEALAGLTKEVYQPSLPVVSLHTFPEHRKG